MPGKHARFSPSSANRWIACPASIALIEEVTGGVEETPSPYAHEGSMCHDVAADCLKNKTDPSTYLGEVIQEVLMTQELIDGITMYVDEIRGLTKELKVTGGVIEFGVKITDDCWGTLDVGLWNPDLLCVADLKMGKGVIVAVEDNPQLKIYAIGMLRLVWENHKLKPEKILLKIIQPRTVNPLRTFEITRTELMEWGKTVLIPAIARCKEPITDFNPGEDQCRWCDAKPCAAQADNALHMAEQAFAPFTKHESPKKEIATGGSLLTIEDVAKLLPSFKFISNWINDLEAYALAKALDGVHVPGYKVVEGRSNRAWKGSDEDIKSFIKKESPDTDPMGEPKLLSPAQMEKLLGKKVAEAIGLKDYIHKPPGNNILVVESDKREAVDLSVEDEFGKFVEVATPDGSGLVKTSVEELSAAALDTTIIIEDESTGPISGSGAFAALMGDDDIEDDPDTFIIEDIEVAEDEMEMVFGDVMEDVIAPPSDKDSQTATSGSQDRQVAEQGVSTPPATPPTKAPQRLTVLNMGRGGTTIKQVAAALNISINQVKMQIRYLCERDGYGYIIYDDGSFVVHE